MGAYRWVRTGHVSQQCLGKGVVGRISTASGCDEIVPMV